MDTVNVELSILLLAFLGTILVSVGSGLIWGSCHHAVSAQVVSEQPLPEYGRCLVNVTYTSYDGVRYDASVNSACSPQPQTSTMPAEPQYIPGCYNHFDPSDLQTKTPVQTVDFIGSMVTFAIGVCLFVFCIGQIVWLIILIRTNNRGEQQQQHDKTVGLSVRTLSSA